MIVSRVAAVALVGGLTALSSTACLGGGKDKADPPPPPPAPSDTAAPAAAGQDAPAGWKTIGGPDNGLKIAVPGGWVDIAISTGEVAAGLDRLGVKGANRELMQQSISQLQSHKGVYAVRSATVDTDFTTNVNALCTPAPGTVTVEQLKAGSRTGLQQIGAANVQIADATVGGRPGIRTTYQMKAALGVLTGVQAQVADTGRTCTVTVTAKEGTMPSDAEAITDTLRLL